MKTVWKISLIEIVGLLRSTKIIVLALFVIFVNIQIITPLRSLSAAMGHRLSVLEPFAAIGNSGLVVLILPFFFMTMMADFPKDGVSRYFCRIRCSKRTWVMGQILYAVESSVLMTLFTLVSSVIMSADFISFATPDYSYAVTKYVSTFPERSGEYVVNLIPENLYNQIPLPVATLHTALLLILYFIMLSLIILIFSLLKKKTAGLFTDAAIIISGAVACAGRTAYMWILPMSHTITWLHYTEYQRSPVLPLYNSYMYFIIADLALIIPAVLISRRCDGI